MQMGYFQSIPMVPITFPYRWLQALLKTVHLSQSDNVQRPRGSKADRGGAINLNMSLSEKLPFRQVICHPSTPKELAVFRYYIRPITWKMIPTTKRPRMITIGETFFLSRYMHRKVSSRAASPGTREFRLSCSVVTLVGSRDMPEAYCAIAVLMPSAPWGRFAQSM